MTSVGAMDASLAGLAEYLDWSREEFQKTFDVLVESGFVRYYKPALYLELPRFFEFEKPESTKIVEYWKVALDRVPECDDKDRLVARLKSLATDLGKSYRKAFDKLSKGHSETIRKEKEQEG